MKKINFLHIGIILIILGVITRLFPHPPNFTPIFAIALFAGTKFKNIKYSFLIPISAMLISIIIMTSL